MSIELQPNKHIILKPPRKANADIVLIREEIQSLQKSVALIQSYLFKIATRLEAEKKEGHYH